MAATININEQDVDAYCRYKMPELQIKREGRGNGTKTIITNLVDVARSLDRPVVYIIKYFGYTLGAQVNCETNVINGTHTVDRLRELLSSFIMEYVLCQICKNPETSLSSHHKCITQNCRACGGIRNITNGKLINYILKQTTPNTSNNIQQSSIPDDNQWLTKTFKERIDIYYTSISKKPLIMSHQDIYDMAVDLGIKSKATMVLAEVLFSDNLLSDLKKYTTLLQMFTNENTKAQMYLLRGVEKTILLKPHLLNRVVQIFYILYDNDLVDEDVFNAWLIRKTKSDTIGIREHASKFFYWLRDE